MTKLKIFFSRTTGPISTKLATNHPRVKLIEVCSNEGLCPFPRGDNYKRAKIHYIKFIKSSCPEPFGLFQPNLAQRNLGWRGLNILQIRNFQCLKRRRWCFFLSKLALWYNHSYKQMCLLIWTVSQVSDVAHGPLVSVWRYLCHSIIFDGLFAFPRINNIGLLNWYWLNFGSSWL